MRKKKEKKNSKDQFSEAVKKAARMLYRSAPILIGVILLIGLANTLIPIKSLVKLFGENQIINSLIGAGLGSILAGTPITSYVLGGEFLERGISLVAVTAFIVAWVSVGIVQLPAESMLLGKKFAITRNLISFAFSIIVAIITVAVMSVI